jgi:hypothetical protein
MIRMPSVHLNGTSREALTNGYLEAAQAVSKARRALCEAAPNARDYYVQGEGAFGAATREHQARDQKLKDVLDELTALVEFVEEAP